MSFRILAVAAVFTAHFALPALANEAAPVTTEVEYFADGDANLEDLMSPEEIEVELQRQELEALLSGEMLFPRSIPSIEGELFVLVDKSEQRLWVYQNGQMTDTWLVSTGTNARKCPPTRSTCYIARTPVGTFKPQRMHAHYRSQLWRARMDWAIFIYGGIALHMTEDVGRLGTPASGGCIRQHNNDAEKLFRLVQAYGMANTTVQIRE
jgi:hypothetical protein